MQDLLTTLNDIRAMALDNRKIVAIQEYRQIFGAGLAECKADVEGLISLSEPLRGGMVLTGKTSGASYTTKSVVARPVLSFDTTEKMPLSSLSHYRSESARCETRMTDDGYEYVVYINGSEMARFDQASDAQAYVDWKNS